MRTIHICMELVTSIKLAVQDVLQEKYRFSADPADILVNETKTEFTGDYTVVLFSFSKTLKVSPEMLGNEMGKALVESNRSLFSGFNVIKGFLNLEIADSKLLDFLNTNYHNASYGIQA